MQHSSNNKITFKRIFCFLAYLVNILARIEIRARSWKLPERFADLPIGKYQELLV